jgi:hypothetical protein
LLVLWCAVPLALCAVKASAWLTAEKVLSAPDRQARSYGRHFIVGYWRVKEVEPLVSKGLVGGIFVTRHNISGGTQALRAEIAHLQKLRRQAGLPPLIVTTDQAGGLVWHLSPPLVARPPLTVPSTFLSLRNDIAHSAWAHAPTPHSIQPVWIFRRLPGVKPLHGYADESISAGARHWSEPSFSRRAATMLKVSPVSTRTTSSPVSAW